MPGRNNKKGGKKPEPEPEIESDEGEDEGVELTPDIQQRLMKLMDPEFAEKFIMGLEDGVRNRVRALQGIQKEINDIRDKYLAEHKELEKRYESLAEPIFQQRVAIVTGKKEVTDEEAQKGQGEFVAKADASTTPANVPGIPEFWLTVMKHNDDLNDTITERDEECLKFLEDITCKTFDDPDKGFILEFHFAENPFFTNKLLVKTYHLLEEEDLMLDKAEGCEIDWKPGKNLTVVIKKKKQKSKGAKNVRTVTKEEPCESFFNFFSPPQIPDDMDEEEEDELMEGGLEQQVEADYEIGRILKETVIPRAVLWYTGEAIPVDSDSDEGENEK